MTQIIATYIKSSHESHCSLYQWFQVAMLKSSLRKFSVLRYDLFNRYGCVPFVVVKHRLSSFLVHRHFFLFKVTNMAGTTNEGRITYHPEALKFTLFCSKAHVAQFLVCYGSLIESPCLFSFGHFIVCPIYDNGILEFL